MRFDPLHSIRSNTSNHCNSFLYNFYILDICYGAYCPNLAAEYRLLGILVGSPFQTSSYQTSQIFLSNFYLTQMTHYHFDIQRQRQKRYPLCLSFFWRHSFLIGIKLGTKHVIYQQLANFTKSYQKLAKENIYVNRLKSKCHLWHGNVYFTVFYIMQRGRHHDLEVL